MKFNHLGIPTVDSFDGEIPLAHLKVTVSDHLNNPSVPSGSDTGTMRRIPISSRPFRTSRSRLMTCARRSRVIG